MKHFDPGQPLPTKPSPMHEATKPTRATVIVTRIVAVIMAALAAGVLWVAVLAIYWLTKVVLG